MKIAVLVPVYNAERYLRECLDSILLAGARLNARDSLDVFCCDDGSTDSSREILSEYAAGHPGVHFCVQDNRGVVVARNRLLDELPPEYEAFAFVDSDDLVAPETYAVLCEAMQRTQADVAECGMPGNAVARERVVDDMSLYLLRRTAPGPWINVVNKLYRRQAVGTIRFREGLCFEEDFFFNCEVHAAIRRKVLLPGVYYTYRDNPDSATHALNFERYFDSASRRINLSREVFLAAGRIPEALKPAWCAELTKDVYRMCIRKSLKHNRNSALRRRLFDEAGRLCRHLAKDNVIAGDGLNAIQRRIFRACANGNYFFARILVALT